MHSREFVGQVLRFQGHLPGNVKRQRIGAVAIKDRAQALCGFADGDIDAGAHRILVALMTQVRRFHTPRFGDGLAAGRAFGT